MFQDKEAQEWAYRKAHRQDWTWVDDEVCSLILDGTVYYDIKGDLIYNSSLMEVPEGQLIN